MMKAAKVLDDCRAALNAADLAETEQDFRILWVALLSLLRAVGHVLHKVDAPSDPALNRAIKDAWRNWSEKPEEHAVFWDFIEWERNAILKTYEFGTHAGDVGLAHAGPDGDHTTILGQCLFTPLEDGPFAGEDGRDVAREAIEWWDGQLALIQRNVG